VVLAGLVLNSTGLIHELRSLRVVGCGMVIFGVILYLADKYSPKNRLNGPIISVLVAIFRIDIIYFLAYREL